MKSVRFYNFCTDLHVLKVPHYPMCFSTKCAVVLFMSYVMQKQLDKDKEQAKLELEMQKRRERIEKWRAEKRKKEMDSVTPAEDTKEKPEVKKWSLEEDESDEDENGTNGNEGADEDDEVDPLDAYMSEVSKEVRKIKGGMNMKNSKVFKKPGAVKEEGMVT